MSGLGEDRRCGKGVSIDSHFRITGVETPHRPRQCGECILYRVVHLRVIILLGHASEIP